MLAKFSSKTGSGKKLLFVVYFNKNDFYWFKACDLISIDLKQQNGAY